MKRTFSFILAALTSLAACAMGPRPVPGQFFHPLQQRDSALVADQFDYGVVMENLPSGTRLVLPEWDETVTEGVEVVKGWTVDTLRRHRVRKGAVERSDVRVSLRLTSFDEGYYTLPGISLKRWYADGAVDSLEFDSVELDVFEMPIDTATFQVHDIKEQITYPVTPDELFPWCLGAEGIVLLVAAIMCAVGYAGSLKRREEEMKEPAHIVALRKLDRFRGEKFWEDENQKAFYSGVTDTIREYIDRRFGVSAMEMTTAEIFKDLSGETLKPDLFNDMKDLFERADFVKFAKHVASREENASVLPLSVRFVTETYQEEIDKEAAAQEKKEG